MPKPRSSKSKGAKVEAFLNSTGTSKNVATNKYFNQNPNFMNLQYQAKAIQSPMEELYRRYKEASEDMIKADGIISLANDLEVDPLQDVVMLVMSWHMKAETMGEFTKQGFLNGLKELKVDSLERLRSALPAMRAELKDKNKFAKVYNFTFGWAKEKGQKSLQQDTAVAMWQLLFAEMTPKWPWVDQWCEFLEETHWHEADVEVEGKKQKKKEKTAISKDTWTQLLTFVRKVDPSMSNLDDETCWPSLVDEFVEYLVNKGLVTLPEKDQTEE